MKRSTDSPPGHPFSDEAPGRAIAAALTVVAMAYFVWWGCFTAVIPMPDPCGGLCCPDCACCSSPYSDEPYCSEPGGTCPFRCPTPGEFFACGCPETGLTDTCFCLADGTYDPCNHTCDVPGASSENCFCPMPVTVPCNCVDGGAPFDGGGLCECLPGTGVPLCTCRDDGTFDPCQVGG